MPLVVLGQQIRGRVTDTEGEPLIGASRYWASTTVGTATDVEGNYQLYPVKGYRELVATYIGYTNDTVRVEAGITVETDGWGWGTRQWLQLIVDLDYGIKLNRTKEME
jgi:hypothetical protein